MNSSARPVIVPTALSHGVLLWSAVFVLYFAVALLAYGAWCRFVEAREALSAPVRTPVAAELFSLSMPSEYTRYALRDNHLTMYVRRDRAVPLCCVVAQRDPAFAYRALDLNPAFLARRIHAALKGEGVVDADHDRLPVVLATALRHTPTGQPAAFAYFHLGAWDGVAYTFFSGDINYLSLSLLDETSRLSLEELRFRLEEMVRTIVLTEAPERFLRPIVNSAEMDAAEHARIVDESTRELALWKMHASRVETEPEQALLPAIEHFRRLLSLRSSVREERELLASDDFRRYTAFLARRAAVVRDWFLLLDKHEAVGDLAAAEKQADFIVRHATLEDESLSRRRAAQIGASVRARRAAPQKEGN